MDKRLGWHFANNDLTLGYNDGRKIVAGETLSVEGKPECCEFGLHASERIIDALQHAGGHMLTRIEGWGDIDENSDKFCGTHRKALWIFNAERVLHEFACVVAEEALSKQKDPDHRSLAAIDAKRKWLRGEITDDELAVARTAAWAAESAAAWDAAWAAAWDAASTAARAAARAAALTAALTAARAAARAAAWDAASDAAVAASRAAARAAAWAAASDAARAEQNELLEKMIMEARNELPANER